MISGETGCGKTTQVRARRVGATELGYFVSKLLSPVLLCCTGAPVHS